MYVCKDMICVEKEDESPHIIYVAINLYIIQNHFPENVNK